MRSLRWEWVGLGAILLVTAAIYSQVAGFGFAGTDDSLYVSENAAVRAGLTRASIAYAFQETLLGNWHPMTWLSWMADQQIHGGRPGGFHLTNAALHLLGTGLLFVSLRRLTGRAAPSLFVAGLFALHPLRVESVAWIAERKDVLSGVFWMLTLQAYAVYVQRGRRPAAYAAVLACFALGLMSKPMLVTLPFVLLLLDAWPLGRLRAAPGSGESTGRLLLEKLPLLALSVAFGVATLRIHAGQQAIGELPLELRVANAAHSYVAYLRDHVWPAQLAFYYPHPLESVRMDLALWAAAFLAAVSALCLAAWRRHPYLLVGWLWFLGTLLPVIGMHDQARADRYSYLPSIGLYLMLSFGLADLARRLRVPSRVVTALAAAVLAVFAGVTWTQLGHWRDAESIYRRALEVSPRDTRLLYDLGTLLSEQQRNDEAAALLSDVTYLEPDHMLALMNLGGIRLAQDRLDEARAAFRAAARLRPRHPMPQYQLAVVLTKQREFDEAIKRFERALRFDPELLAAREGMADALMKAGREDEAVAVLRELLARHPDHVTARRLLDQLESRASAR